VKAGVVAVPRPKRGKLSDHVVTYLAREIAGDRLPAGHPLPAESELGVQLGVSKAVVRESFQALAALGMAVIQQGKRTTVLPRDRWNVLAPIVQEALYNEGHAAELTRQLYEVRLVLESRAAAWAALRADQRARTALTDLVEGMHAAESSQDVHEFLQVDREFHEKIAAVAGNVILPVVLRSLSSSLFGGWERSQATVADLLTLTDQHARVAAAIESGDPAAASAAMEAHLEWARQHEAARAGLRGGDPAT
jgi:GntR family transcriptional repressor for pyruvate dehydrogenase complex